MPDPKSAPEILYGIAAIAAFLGIPRRVAQHRLEAGVIPHVRMGRSVCATPAALRGWLAECEAKARGEVAS